MIFIAKDAVMKSHSAGRSILFQPVRKRSGQRESLAIFHFSVFQYAAGISTGKQVLGRKAEHAFLCRLHLVKCFNGHAVAVRYFDGYIAPGRIGGIGDLHFIRVCSDTDEDNDVFFCFHELCWLVMVEVKTKLYTRMLQGYFC